ncbi:MAG: O-antigen ligase family protein [Candidatus Dojkabacteria bacterium]|jgi:O-antigen ligase
MLKKFFKKKDIGIILIFVFVFAVLSFFAKESLSRYFSVLLFLIIFLLTFLFTKNIFFSFLTFLFLTLPFNITYQLPIAFEKTLVNNIHVNYLVPTVSILDIGVFIFLISLLITKLNYFKIIFHKYKISFLLFTIFLLIQNILFKDVLVALNSLRFFSYLFSFLLFLEYFRTSKLTKKQIIICSTTLLFSILIQGIIGYLQFKRGASLGLKYLGESQVAAGLLGSSFISLSGKAILRSYGTFPHPNILAGYFLLSFFISIYFLKKVEGKWKVLPIVGMTLSSIFISFTFSRSTIFLFVITIFVLLFRTIFTKKKLFFFSTPLLLERFSSLFQRTDTGVVDRKNLLKASLPIIKKNMLQGTGLGKFIQYMGEDAPLTKNGLYLLQPVHNIFVLLLTEFGLFGFLSFLFLLFDILRKNIQKINIFVLLVLLTVIGIGLVDHYFVSLPQGLIMFWIFIGLVILFSKDLRKNKKNIDS